MTHRIKIVKPLDDFVLLIEFQNGVEKKYDMKTLYSVFPQFKDFEIITGLFEQVKVDVGGYGISWNDDLDLDCEEIWENGIQVRDDIPTNVNDQLGVSLVNVRLSVGMTQKQLAEATGIYQADISKIERGIGNPSLSTLKRLASGMNMKLRLEFIPNNTGK